MTTSYIIFVGSLDGCVRVGYISGSDPVEFRMVDAPPESDDDAVWPGAEHVISSLKELDWKRQPVVLAVDSSRCLCASVSTDRLPRRGSARRQASVFELERQLPVSIEQVVIDFTGDRTLRSPEMLGIAVHTDWLGAIVEDAHANGITVSGICPASLLAIHHLSKNHSLAHIDLLLWPDGESCEIFFLRQGIPIAWHHTPAHLPDLKRVVCSLVIARNTQHVLIVCPEKPIQHMLADELGLQVQQLDEPEFTEAACKATRDYQPHTDSSTFSINLLRAPMVTPSRLHPVRTSLGTACVTFALLMVVLCAVLVWKNHLSQKTDEQVERQQHMLFHQLFPDIPTPPSVTGYMQSEAVKLRNLQGLVRNTNALRDERSALTLLYETLRRLPTNQRYRLLEIRCAANKLYIEGQTRSHGAATQLAASLRHQNGFTIEPPRTEQTRDGAVTFTMSGKLPSKITGPVNPTRSKP